MNQIKHPGHVEYCTGKVCVGGLILNEDGLAHLLAIFKLEWPANFTTAAGHKGWLVAAQLTAYVMLNL